MANSRPLPHLSLPRLAPGGRLELLRGIRVLDLTSSIAGPYATMLLADLGADIVKIERPNMGDDSRYWRPPELDGNALWVSSVNRNKRSLTLDYSREEGRKVLMELVRKSDVVVTNQLPKVQAKLGPTSHVHRTHPTRRVRRHHHQPRGGAQCPELRHVTRDRPGARRCRSCGRPGPVLHGSGAQGVLRRRGHRRADGAFHPAGICRHAPGAGALLAHRKLPHPLRRDRERLCPGRRVRAGDGLHVPPRHRGGEVRPAGSQAGSSAWLRRWRSS